MHKTNGLRTYDGAVAIITGGASGIGKALSEELARRGSHVIVADLQEQRAETVAAHIRSSGGQATAVPIDVTDFPAVRHTIEAIVATHGRLDYLFNNAGITVNGEVRDYQLEDWNRVFDVNIRGVSNGIQAAYAIMIRQGFGHIVNTASVAGLVPSPLCVSYSASKHAIVGMTLALRIEAEAVGVRVSVVCPGVIRTPLLDGGQFTKNLQPVDPGRWQAFWDRHWPMEPEKFAPPVLRGVAKNKAIIVVPWWWHLPWRLARFSPALGLFLGRKFFHETQKALRAPPSTPSP